MIVLLVAVAVADPAAPSAPNPTKPVATSPAVLKAATPLAERVVRFAALNKRNGETQEFELKPGGEARFATLTIRVRSCETTPLWEQKLTGAYLQIDDSPVSVRAGTAPKPRRVYSGWMFAESPSLNPLQHPLYDVWVRSCTMSFPETGPDTLVAGRAKAAAAKASNAAKSPAADSAPSN